MKGYDPDGGAQTEGDHFRQFCPICGELVDMRDLAQLRRAIEIGEGRCAAAARSEIEKPAARPVPVGSCVQ
jgi:hypothetical protein